MSQYLSHIANLALNRVAVVQPRLASRFEGAAGVAPVEDNQQRLAEAPVSHHQVSQPAQPQTAPTRQPQAEPASAAIRAQNPLPPALEPQAMRQQTQPAAAPAPTPGATEPPLLVQQLVRESIHEQPLLVPALTPSVAMAPELGQPAAERLVERSLLVEHRTEAPVSNKADGILVNPKTESRQDTPPASKAPHIQTRIAAPEPASQSIAQRPVPPVEAAALGPSIQVSIGRIEIRANPASSAGPAAKPKVAPATLSLDDYLKQRKGDR